MPLPTTAEEIPWDSAITIATAAKFMQVKTVTMTWHANRPARPLRTIKIGSQRVTTYRWLWEWTQEPLTGRGMHRPPFPIAGAVPPPESSGPTLDYTQDDVSVRTASDAARYQTGTGDPA